MGQQDCCQHEDQARQEQKVPAPVRTRPADRGFMVPGNAATFPR